MLTYCNLVITYHSLVFYHLAQCGRVSFDRLERSRSRIRDCLYAVEGKTRTKRSAAICQRERHPFLDRSQNRLFCSPVPVWSLSSGHWLVHPAYPNGCSVVALLNLAALCFLLSPDNLRLGSFWSLAPECVCAARGSL